MSHFLAVSRTLMLFCFLIAVSNCTIPKEEAPEIYYILGEEEKIINDRPIDATEPPPPPVPFYGKINIILLGESEVYVHKVSPKFYIDHDFDEQNNGVVLKRSYLKRVNLNRLPEFLATEFKNTNDRNNREYFTCIKSSSDTIISKAFPEIQNFFKHIKFDKYIIRKWTAEEMQAIELVKKEK